MRRVGDLQNLQIWLVWHPPIVRIQRVFDLEFAPTRLDEQALAWPVIKAGYLRNPAGGLSKLAEANLYEPARSKRLRRKI